MQSPSIKSIILYQPFHFFDNVDPDGMRRTLAGVRPTAFGDIIALVSLYRPGPMDNIPLFGDRKNGREHVGLEDRRVPIAVDDDRKASVAHPEGCQPGERFVGVQHACW